MQRKTCTLNSRRNSNRGGFAMIMAIFFMIIMATLMASMLAATSETSKRTINNYLLAQVQLVAKSSVEYAILQVSAHDRGVGGTNCLQDITIDYPASDLTATVRINYFGLGAGCAGNGTADTIQTAESNGTMLIDVYVESDVTLGLTEPIRFHRRTLQKL